MFSTLNYFVTTLYIQISTTSASGDVVVKNRAMYFFSDFM